MRKIILFLLIFSTVGLYMSTFANDWLKEQYKKWSMGDISKWSFINDTPDCLNLSSDLNSNTGDLLSTLIVGDITSPLNLEVYTPEYLAHLDRLVAKKTKVKWNSNFYSHYLCHIGTDLDVLVWKIYTTRNAPWYLVIRNKNTIKFYSASKIRLMNNHVTWWDVSFCNAKLNLKSTAVLWSCFIGLDRDRLRSYLKEYRISLHTNRISIRNYIK